jgi:bis(5'-nucleosidyl)-tetraphosphatase
VSPEVKSCGVLLVRGEPIDRFLLMKHHDRWDLPKGHVDPGETELHCALREMEEETGIPRELVSIDPEFRFAHRYHVQGPRTNWEKKLKELVIFLGRLPRDMEITVTEHIDFAWFDWDPPHAIQERTIDPLLRALEEHLQQSP